MHSSFILSWLVAFGILLAGASAKDTTEPVTIQQYIRQGKVGDVSFSCPQDLNSFYSRRQFAAGWSRRHAEALTHAIDRAPAHGLFSERYHSRLIRELLNHEIAGGKFDAALDVLLSDAFFLFYRHISRGVLDPPDSWPQIKQDALPVVALAEAIQTNQIEETLYNAAPDLPEYRRLQVALERYRTIEASGGWSPIVEGALMDKASVDLRVVDLRRRLKATGDLAADTAETPVFDEEVDRAVRRFQERHGLRVDAIVGSKTLAELNVPVRHRISQLAVNLDRTRWLLTDFGSRYVVVNIPAYELRAVESYETALTMRIVVGSPDWCSPVFMSSSITELETNPYWYVPQIIAEKEIWPMVEKDPAYLKRKRIVMIPRPDGSIQLRQRPGIRNSLGRLKIVFPNDCGCYMHDTPEKELFEKPQRAFSHGCIRLENAFLFSDFLLSHDGQWPQGKLREFAESGGREQILLADPVPIYLLYFTAWVEDPDTLNFRKDIYGLDRRAARSIGLSGSN